MGAERLEHARDFEWIASRAAGRLPTPRWWTRATATPCWRSRGRGRWSLGAARRAGRLRLKYYGFAQGTVDGAPALISRTGSRGRTRFELYLAPEDAPRVWRRLLAAGALPAGLGARDTLRLEAAMSLYGHEIDETTTPFEAGLSWVVKLDKGDFLGRDALLARKAAGSPRRLVGFEVQGRGIARQGHGVVSEGAKVGEVTSGTWSPTFEKALGLAYVPPEMAAVGTPLALDVRGKALPATVVETPFYRRPR